jgi:hypothetical protein
MIKSELLKDKGVLIVSPVGPLGAPDFEHLAGEIKGARTPSVQVHPQLNEQRAGCSMPIS